MENARIRELAQDLGHIGLGQLMFVGYIMGADTQRIRHPTVLPGDFVDGE